MINRTSRIENDVLKPGLSRTLILVSKPKRLFVKSNLTILINKKASHINRSA